MSDAKKPEPSEDPKVDSELSELLDSALEDFKAAPATEPPKAVAEEDDIPTEWSQDFIRQAAADFESNMASLSQLSPEQLQERFQQMAETARQVIDNPTVTDESNDFAATISQTLQGLSEGAEGLQNPFSEQELMGLLGNGDQNAFMPFMQGMMQSLLSKDVLYPSLKDILDKFPDYLKDNKEKLSKEDYERYEKQKELMEEVCAELLKEKPGDSDEQKKEQFQKVLTLMQKLQDYGQPPTELVGDVGPPLPDLQNATDPNQCSLM